MLMEDCRKLPNAGITFCSNNDKNAEDLLLLNFNISFI